MLLMFFFSCVAFLAASVAASPDAGAIAGSITTCAPEAAADGYDDPLLVGNDAQDGDVEQPDEDTSASTLQLIEGMCNVTVGQVDKEKDHGAVSGSEHVGAAAATTGREFSFLKETFSDHDGILGAGDVHGKEDSKGDVPPARKKREQETLPVLGEGSSSSSRSTTRRSLIYSDVVEEAESREAGAEQQALLQLPLPGAAWGSKRSLPADFLPLAQQDSSVLDIKNMPEAIASPDLRRPATPTGATPTSPPSPDRMSYNSFAPILTDPAEDFESDRDGITTSRSRTPPPLLLAVPGAPPESIPERPTTPPPALPPLPDLEEDGVFYRNNKLRQDDIKTFHENAEPLIRALNDGTVTLANITGGSSSGKQLKGRQEKTSARIEESKKASGTETYVSPRGDQLLQPHPSVAALWSVTSIGGTDQCTVGKKDMIKQDGVVQELGDVLVQEQATQVTRPRRKEPCTEPKRPSKLKLEIFDPTKGNWIEEQFEKVASLACEPDEKVRKEHEQLRVLARNAETYSGYSPKAAEGRCAREKLASLERKGTAKVQQRVWAAIYTFIEAKEGPPRERYDLVKGLVNDGHLCSLLQNGLTVSSSNYEDEQCRRDHARRAMAFHYGPVIAQTTYMDPASAAKYRTKNQGHDVRTFLRFFQVYRYELGYGHNLWRCERLASEKVKSNIPFDPWYAALSRNANLFPKEEEAEEKAGSGVAVVDGVVEKSSSRGTATNVEVVIGENLKSSSTTGIVAAPLNPEIEVASSCMSAMNCTSCSKRRGRGSCPVAPQANAEERTRCLLEKEARCDVPDASTVIMNDGNRTNSIQVQEPVSDSDKNRVRESPAAKRSRRICDKTGDSFDDSTCTTQPEASEAGEISKRKCRQPADADFLAGGGEDCARQHDFPPVLGGTGDSLSRTPSRTSPLHEEATSAGGSALPEDLDIVESAFEERRSAYQSQFPNALIEEDANNCRDYLKYRRSCLFRPVITPRKRRRPVSRIDAWATEWATDSLRVPAPPRPAESQAGSTQQAHICPGENPDKVEGDALPAKLDDNCVGVSVMPEKEYRELEFHYSGPIRGFLSQAFS
ncbi:unnamed protein product [Amoebophrya sp. A25]|nr:unnamed protein product [Amoebophrya sp. A25]|eukprot:GSA25T00020110001.1